MAALDFPNSGLYVGLQYTGPNGISYTYDGNKWIGQNSSTPGPTGPQGPQGLAGINGRDGTDGAPGLNGQDGLNGTNGQDGANGAPGSNGLDGAPGLNGLDGLDGTNGTNGADGAPGLNGTDGAPGLNGQDGLNGTNGADGSKGDKGDTGEQGISIVLVGSSATTTVASLGQGSVGQGWINTTDGDVYFWNTLTVNWENIGPIVGPQGDKGDSGDKGEKGDTGQNGLNGQDGRSAYELAVLGGFVGTQTDWLSSLIGPAGADGADGVNGQNGQNGQDGRSAYELAVLGGFVGTQTDWLASLIGPAGADGTNGADGVNGQNGQDGRSSYELAVLGGFSGTQAEWLTSLVGQNGLNGFDGPQGPQGEPGFEGPTGPSGAQGEPGVEGPTGAQGEPGFEGPTGPSGAQGEPGVEGPTGAQGEPGFEGPTGPSGANGFDGPQGPQGEPGVEGPTGPSGANGFDGPQGPQGEPGTDALWNWQGAYDVGPQYQEGDVVSYQGSTYRRNNYSNSAMGFPPTDTEYWEVVAQKGAAGTGGGSSFDQDLNTYDDVVFANLRVTSTTTFLGTVVYGEYQGYDDLSLIKDESVAVTLTMRNLHNDGSSEIVLVDSYSGGLHISHQNSSQGSGSLAAGENYIHGEGPPDTLNIGLYSNINFFADSNKFYNTTATTTSSMQISNIDGSVRFNKDIIADGIQASQGNNLVLKTVNANTWTFGSNGALTLPNASTISSSDIGFSYTAPSNGPGGYSVSENSLTVGIPNPSWAADILANPNAYHLDFNGGPTGVAIGGISGPAPSTNVYTLTGTWPANATGFPMTIASDNYVADLTTISSDNGLQVSTTGGSWTFGLDGTTTFPNNVIKQVNGTDLSIATTSVIGRINATSVTVVSSGTYYLDNSSYATDYPNTIITTLGGPSPLVNGGFLLESTEIFTVGDIITIPASIQNNTTATLQVTSTLPYSWSFANTGQLNLPQASNGTARIQSTADIDILSGNSLWTFGTLGVLTLPSGNTRIGNVFGSDAIVGNTGTSVGVLVQGTGGYVGLQWVDNPDLIGTTSTQVQVASVIVNSPIASTTGTVQILTGITTGTGIGSNIWEFGADGTLTIPDDIQDANGSVVRVATTSTAPTRVNGQLWFNNQEGRLYIKNDGVWIDASPVIVPLPNTYLDEITIDGSTLNINGSTLTISNTGTLLVNGSEVTGSGTGSSTHIEYTDGQSGYTSTVDLGYNFEVDVDNSHLDINGNGYWSIGSNNFDTKIFSTEDPGNDPTVIVVRAGDDDWTFGPLGWFTLPGGSRISDTMGPIRLEPAGASSSTQALEIYPTAFDGNHIHLTAGGGETDLYLGNDSQYVKVDHSGTIVVGTLGATTSTWTFGTDGMLTLPAAVGTLPNLFHSPGLTIGAGTAGNTVWEFGTNGVLTLSTASTILGNSTDPNVYIETATTATTSTWTFGTNGILTLPAATPVIKGGGTGTDVTIIASTGSNTSTWTFAADGSTTLPIGVSIDEYYGSHFPRIVADTGKAFSVQGYGSTGSVALQWAETASTSSQIAQVALNRFNGIAAVTLTAGTSTNDMKVWTFDADGKLTLPGALVKSTVAKTGVILPTTTGIPNALGGSMTGLSLANGMYGPVTIGGVTFSVTVAGGNITSFFDISSTSSYAVNATIGQLTSEDLGDSPGQTTNIGVDSVFQETPTALDLTKSVNKLTDGDYTLANGVEGQIMYLVRQTGSTAHNVTVANVRLDGTVYTDVSFTPFTDGTDPTNMATLIFTDGAWQSMGGFWNLT